MWLMSVVELKKKVAAHEPQSTIHSQDNIALVAGDGAESQLASSNVDRAALPLCRPLVAIH
jgi:hypothetical protein